MCTYNSRFFLDQYVLIFVFPLPVKMRQQDSMFSNVILMLIRYAPKFSEIKVQTNKNTFIGLLVEVRQDPLRLES